MLTIKSIKWVIRLGLHFGIKRLMSTEIVTNNYQWAQKLDVVDVMLVSFWVKVQQLFKHLFDLSFIKIVKWHENVYHTSRKIKCILS